MAGAKLRIAMIGTRGVPARYGGFETAVEEVGSRLAKRGHEVTVFCRPDPDGPGEEHLGMRRVELPIVRKRSLETLAHTALSVINPALRDIQVALVFNAANALLLPVIRARRIPVATHVDGLEWQRGKWGSLGRRYYRLAERLAVRWSDDLIADARGIADYYRSEFDAETTMIAYGAPINLSPMTDRLASLGLEPGGYHLVVARFEPENHVREIVAGYVASRARLPLVVVGSAPYAEAYTARVEAAADDRVRLLGAIWDQDQLDQLYRHCRTYLHGHSVGGTNPSLLRAAGAGAYPIAYDVIFNREVIGGHGGYFSGPADVTAEIMAAEREPDRVRAAGAALQEAIRRYDWDDVADGYERLCHRLAARSAKAA
ncbi:DUF1972 domain-containing protein [Microlunatus sp. GCM10028923]|uniref:DUF1972 domain-containing protein n=1 Tax=Microlunatus sp. GCM10028923 TaxID=3273400 RepID=UPI00360C9487